MCVKLYFIFLILLRVTVSPPIHRYEYRNQHVSRASSDINMAATTLGSTGYNEYLTAHFLWEMERTIPSTKEATDIPNAIWGVWESSQPNAHRHLKALHKIISQSSRSLHFVQPLTRSLHFDRPPTRLLVGKSIEIEGKMYRISYINKIDHEKDHITESYFDNAWRQELHRMLKMHSGKWSTLLLEGESPPAMITKYNPNRPELATLGTKCTWVIFFYDDSWKSPKTVHAERLFFLVLGPPTTRVTTTTKPTSQTVTRNAKKSSNEDETTTTETGATTTEFLEVLLTSISPAVASDKSIFPKYAIYIIITILLAAIIGFFYWAYKATKRSHVIEKEELPDQWQRVGPLINIYVYPVKSCAPVSLTEAECSFLGLQDGWLRDRFFMIVDERNNYISARNFPELLTVQPSVKLSILTLQYASIEMLKVDLAEVKNLSNSQKAFINGISVPVLDCGWTAGEWFSRILSQRAGNKKFRLVYYASETGRRPTSNTHKTDNPTRYDTGAFSNETPYHLINQASVDDLNTRLKDLPVTHLNFRPNFFVSSAKAYDENRWKFIKIGNNIFQVIKICRRCIITTINPDTGERYTQPEPLETLKSYQQTDGAPSMGVQMALRSTSGKVISIGDPVFAAKDSNNPDEEDHQRKDENDASSTNQMKSKGNISERQTAATTENNTKSKKGNINNREYGKFTRIGKKLTKSEKPSQIRTTNSDTACGSVNFSITFKKELETKENNDRFGNSDKNYLNPYGSKSDTNSGLQNENHRIRSMTLEPVSSISNQSCETSEDHQYKCYVYRCLDI